MKSRANTAKVYRFCKPYHYLLLLVTVFFLPALLQAQVCISTDGSDPHSSAMLEVKSNNKGLLVPRVTTLNRVLLGIIAQGGLIVYDSDMQRFFLHNGTQWKEISTGNLWTKSGNFTYVTNSTDSVGIGTSTPARSFEVKGGWQTARLSSETSGAFLEFVGIHPTDWAVGAWAGSLRFSSSTDEFANSTTEYFINTTHFRPFECNTKYLGHNDYRWKNTYSIDGDFSGNVNIVGNMNAGGNMTVAGGFNTTGYVGIGTSTPARQLEVNGDLWTARISASNDNGAFLEMIGTNTTDWAIGTWDGAAQLSSSTNEFASSQSEYIFRTDRFRPYTNNSKDLGSSGYRWKSIFSIDGDFSGDVGIGTSTPARKLEVQDTDWNVARLSSTNSGAFLEFVGSHATDWSFGTWDGTARISSSTDEFVNSTTEYCISTTSFFPWVTNSKYLGTSTTRWKTLYTIDGDFSGDVDIDGDLSADGDVDLRGDVDITGNVGIGTASPARKLEVRDTDWNVARLSSTNSGAFLEFVGSHATDWSFGAWDGTARISSSTNEFANSTTEYCIASNSFFPWTSNSKDLGISTSRWKNLYSIDGNFSGDVAIDNDLNTGGDLAVTGDITAAGNMGIGTTSPARTLEVCGPLRAARLSSTTATGTYLEFVGTDATDWSIGARDGSVRFVSSTDEFSNSTTEYYFATDMFYPATGNSKDLGRSSCRWKYIYGIDGDFSGEVAIGGTNATGYKLSVDGKIACEEVLVEDADGWPDYVFTDDYPLISLEELEQHITTQRHLPGIPSAPDIKENGFLIGDMQKKLLEKIEELTLYLIGQNNKIATLEAEIENLKSINKSNSHE